MTKVGLELLGQLKMEGLLHVRVRQFQFSQIFKHFQSELILGHFVKIKLKTSTEFETLFYSRSIMSPFGDQYWEWNDQLEDFDLIL